MNVFPACPLSPPKMPHGGVNVRSTLIFTNPSRLQDLVERKAPSLIYDLILFHLFKDRGEELDEERIITEKAGFSFEEFRNVRAYMEAIRSRSAWQETPKLPGL
jgi:hypothetical protein